MAGERRGLTAGVLLIVVLSALGAGAKSAWEGDGCPPFERKAYEYTVKIRLEGDLYAVEHVRGFTDFRHCYQVRDRVLEEHVRFETQEGAYEVRVAGGGFDDRHLLAGERNSTGWYDAERVETFEYAGVSGSAEPGTNLLPGARDAELTLGLPGK